MLTRHKACRLAYLLGLALLPAASFAADFTVDTTLDSVDINPGDGVCLTARDTCSLRAAVMEANALTGADTITVPSGTYSPGIDNPAAATEDASDDLDIWDDLTIVGEGADTTSITGNFNAFRIFQVHKRTDNSRPTVTFKDLTLTKGAGSGGALYNDGISTLDNVTVTDASPDSSAVYSSYKLTVLNSRIKDNFKGIVSAVNYSGSSWMLDIEDSIFENNSSGRALYSDAVSSRISSTQFLSNSSGGAYFESGTAYIDRSDFVGNSAAIGAAVQTQGKANLTITSSSFTGNTATRQYGGALAVSGQTYVVDSVIKDNSAKSNGGGIHSYAALVLERTELVSNVANGKGAGLYQFRGSLKVYDSIVRDNTTGTFGGGAYIDAEFGDSDYALLHSEFSGNKAKNGGGLYANANVIIKNITMSSNVASVNGGGIANNRRTLALSHVTVSSNEAPNGANLQALNGGLFRLSNTLVANPIGSASCDGNVTSTGYNLDTDNSCGLTEIGDLPSSSPRLGVLVDNGGGTSTHALGSDSDAINAGNPNVCLNNPPLDQRYYYRNDSRCDIGAYEYGSVRAQSGEIVFSQAETQAREGEAAATVTLSRVGGSEGDVSVDVYSTIYGTATGRTDGYSRADFQHINVSVGWSDGDAGDKTVDVTLYNDRFIEGTEEIQLKLRHAEGGASLGQQVDHVVTVYDDEAKPGVLSFTASSQSVDENAGTATLRVSRTQGDFGTVSVDYSSIDGTASSGSDYTAVSDTLTFLNGEVSKTITIDIADDSEVEPTESFRVVLSNPVGGAVLGGNSEIQINVGDNDTFPGEIALEQANYTVNEDGGTLSFKLIRTNGSNGEVAVSLALVNGSADYLSDYAQIVGVGARSVIVPFADGVLERTLEVEISDDNVVEGDETFNLRLGSPQGGVTLGLTSTATVTIKDNDTTQGGSTSGNLSFTNATHSVGEGDGSIVIKVVRTGGSAGEISVDYATVDGDAVAGSDYGSVSDTLVFADGVMSQTITIDVMDDLIYEGDHSFTVELSNVVGGELSNANTIATVTIVDNDANPTPNRGEISIETDSFSIREGQSFFFFTLIREGGTDGKVRVSIELVNGDATYQSDYGPFNGMTTREVWVEFDDGQSRFTIAADVLNDDIGEPDETFTVRIHSPTGGATLGAIDRAVITIKDDDDYVPPSTSPPVVDDSSGGDGTRIGAIHPLVLLFAAFWWLTGAARRRRAASR